MHISCQFSECFIVVCLGCSDDLFLPRIILKPGVVRFKVGTNVPMYYEAIERRIGLLNYSFEWIETLGREDICTWIILELSVLPKLLDSPELSYQSNCFGAGNVLDRNANFAVLSKK